MEIIALANQKGGVAKSTSTYNLAYLKAKEGKRVLMIDLDPQGSLTILCGMVPGKAQFSICNVMMGEDPFVCGYQVEHSKLENLFLIPSDIELAEIEQTLIAKTAREKILKKQLLKFDHEFDYIFIDCPPQLGILTTNALVAADRVIIPTKAEYLSYRGIRALKRTLQTVREEFNSKLVFEGFLVSMFERQINDQKDLLEQFSKEGPILGIVKKSADVYRNVLEGLPVVACVPKSDVSLSYIQIANKI